MPCMLLEMGSTNHWRRRGIWGDCHYWCISSVLCLTMMGACTSRWCSDGGIGEQPAWHSFQLGRAWIHVICVSTAFPKDWKNCYHRQCVKEIRFLDLIIGQFSFFLLWFILAVLVVSKGISDINGGIQELIVFIISYSAWGIWPDVLLVILWITLTCWMVLSGLAFGTIHISKFSSPLDLIDENKCWFLFLCILTLLHDFWESSLILVVRSKDW
jgi:hypothetical protein